MMYGSVLSGALAGHVHGTAAYDVTSTGEPAGWRPHIWTALRYESGAQMQHLRSFVLSEGARYQELTLASQDLAAAQHCGFAGRRTRRLVLPHAHAGARLCAGVLREHGKAAEARRLYTAD